MKKDIRVVVTGIGPVTPIGIGEESFRDALIRGDSGITPLPVEKYGEDFPIKIAGQIKDFNPEFYNIGLKNSHRMSRGAQFGIAATGLALTSARLHIGNQEGDVSPEEVDIEIGKGMTDLETIIVQLDRLNSGKKINPFTVPRMMLNEVVAQISLHHGINGAGITTSGACASSGMAINNGYHRIKNGRTEVVLVGGSDSGINPYVLRAFHSMNALSTSGNYKVLDKDSDGFVIGEGATMFVLESDEHALKRGAPIYAEIKGCASTMDAQHIASPDVSGRQLSRAVKIALKNANAPPEDISYINLHGTGTKNDIIEINALKSVFGEKVYDIPMSSTKSAHGHMIGATSATELAATILGMNYNFLPGTINLEKPVSDINLFSETKTHNYTPLSLVTSQAFGGHDTAQVVERYIRC